MRFREPPKDRPTFLSQNLSPDGSKLLASTLLGGSSEDQPGGVAVDAEGNVYVAGVTGSTDFPTTVGAYRTTLNPTGCPETKGDGRRCYDIFVSKIPPDFTRLQFSTFLGGNGDEFTPQVATDGVGHVYVTGVPSQGLPLFKPIQSERGPLHLTKLNIAGSELLFSTYFGGTLPDGFVPSICDWAESGSRRECVYSLGTTEHELSDNSQCVPNV